LFENIPGYFYFSTLSLEGAGSLSLSIVPERGNPGPHRLSFNLNGTVIEDTTWYGQNEIIFEISDLEFSPTMNLLKVTAEEEPGIIYFNSYRVDYPRSLSYAANRVLRFPDQILQRRSLTLGGAADEYSLLDITNPSMPLKLEGELFRQ